MDKKEKLIKALEEEKEWLPEYDAFGKKNDLHEYDLVIHYLRTGEKPDNWEDYEFLICAVEDIETLYSDYL